MVGCAVLCPRSSPSLQPNALHVDPQNGAGKLYLAQALGRQLHLTQLAAAWAPAAAARCTGLTAAQHSGEASNARQACARTLCPVADKHVPLDEQCRLQDTCCAVGLLGGSTYLLRGVLEALAADVVEHTKGLAQLAVRHLEAHALQAKDDFEELQGKGRGDRAAAVNLAADNNPFEPCQPGWLFEVLRGSGRGTRTRACLATFLAYTFLGRAGTNQRENLPPACTDVRQLQAHRPNQFRTFGGSSGGGGGGLGGGLGGGFGLGEGGGGEGEGGGG